MPSASALDAVTIDAFGTLVTLRDPIQSLRAALADHGVLRRPHEVAAAFEAEARYYVRNALRGRDEQSLRTLHRDCADVFLAELDAPLDPSEFAPAYVAALRFELIAGVREALDVLVEARLVLACVGNWDVTLESHLDRLGIADRFAVIVSSAAAGVEKPDPRIFRLVLDRLGASPERALHIGDSNADRVGAQAAGLAFEPAPLATLPARLGLEERCLRGRRRWRHG